MTPETADADCYIGNPAPKHAASVWHHDLETIPSGERCMECGTLFLSRDAKKTAKEHLAALGALGLKVTITNV